MERYEETFRLDFSTKAQPKKLITARCSRCGNEVAEFTWKSSTDRIVKKKQLKSKTRVCPYCKAKFQ